MLLCVPTTNQRGLQGQVAWHVGRAPYHTLVDTDSGRTEVVGNDDRDHRPGRCDPARALRGRGVDAVACRSMGKRSLARLDRAGIVVLAAEADTVGAVLGAFRAGALHPLTREAAAGTAPGGPRGRRRRRTRARRPRRGASRAHA
jgi:predicted Fe-Mo cluster-binding NifX family protein